MKISELWLREIVSPNIDTESLTAQLTMAGLEVDSVKSVGKIAGAVVVGKILALRNHPASNKLSICDVQGLNGEISEVVCGATNLSIGMKIPFAQTGSILPENIKIERSSIRGVESHGMLCAQTELQLGDDNSGVWELPEDSQVGMLLADYLDLNDNILEIDLTPNRGDCLSINGLAREVGVLNQSYIKEIDCQPVEPTIEDKLQVDIESDACGRYVGRVIRGIDSSRKTPIWMQEKLRRSGLRCLSPIVDVTNYVMLELGQPMHAFDRSKLTDGIVVRMGENETLCLLDDTEILLDETTLVIADEQTPLAIAGIMGGKDSAVSETTDEIVLEAAWFNPIPIGSKARFFGKHTESSHRFERGVDSALQVAAMERATALVINICGGQAGPIVLQESSQNLPSLPKIKFQHANVSKLLGVEIDFPIIEDILIRLGVNQLSKDKLTSVWEPPSWRTDLKLEQDLIEEIARIFGYNNIPASASTAALVIESDTETLNSVPNLANCLTTRGYRDVITYSFVDSKLQKLLEPERVAVSLSNPLSKDMSVMRTNLWPGLVRTAQYNINRQRSRIRIFETGQCFFEVSEKISTYKAMAGLVCGERNPMDWAANKGMSDFFDIKGDVESLIMLTGMFEQFDFVPLSHGALHPGQAASILFDGSEIGCVGQLHPQLQSELNLGIPIFLFHIDLDYIRDYRLPAHKELSKFPEIRRDLALVVKSDIKAGDIVNFARQSGAENLTNATIFDVFEGLEDAQNMKSLGITLTFQNLDRTLSDNEIDLAIERVIEILHLRFGARLRA
jgi:phenylalanyl-tRNA synthetase beta chain